MKDVYRDFFETADVRFWNQWSVMLRVSSVIDYLAKRRWKLRLRGVHEDHEACGTRVFPKSEEQWIV